MVSGPAFSFSLDYFIFVLAVTLNSLLMIIIGGWMTARFQKGGLRFGFANKSTFRKKFFGFFLFIIGIFLAGFLSERLQSTILTYLRRNATTSIAGIIIAVLAAWFLYDWLVWRKHNA
jgi:hypothetical protein